MLLPLTNLAISTLPPKSITDQSLPSLFFFFPSPICRTLTSHKPKPFKFFVRSSSTDTQTLHPQSAIQRIAEKLRDLGFAEENQNTDSEPDGRSSSAGEIFVPLPKHLPKHRVGHTIDSSWSTPENPVPEPGSGTAIARFHKLRREVKEQKQLENKDLWVKKEEERVPTLAELSLPKEELRRLRTLGIALDKKLKIGKAGITEGIVNGIHERWRRSEVVKLVCEDLCKMNMKRTHELLERKTGGMVVWRAGWKIVLYRGPNYKYPYFLCGENSTNDDTLPDSESKDEKLDNLNYSSSGINGVKSDRSIPPTEIAQAKLVQGVGLPNRVRFQLPGEAQLAEEAEELLDGLGPRFTDWWGYDPLPVDADLLPPVVSGYRRPFRLLPYGVNPKLTDDEMTILRRLGRPLPCHFALGRNRNLQGLGSCIVKLWEKCEIAKIAVKRGVQNTNSELMAEELKRLTGGTLIARDKEFIVLYRGKDFLPLAVSSAIEERRKYGMHANKQRIECSSSIKTAEEFKLETADVGKENKHGIHVHKTAFLLEQSKKRPVEASIERTSIKLSMAVEKKVKAEKLLAQLDEASISQQAEIDKEGITEEERYMLRRIGLRMKPFLLLGRRGIFDGTIENMHLHWKYRELVKILSKDKNIQAAHQVAKVLEAESGGILVAVERVNKGYAIIVYRGKNYQRPASLRPQTLLSKRAAMKRSIEAQRRESLKLHVLKLTKNIDDLKLQLARDGENKSVSMDGSNITAMDMNNIQSAEPPRQDVELKSDSLSHSVKLACSEEMVKAGDSEKAHSSPTGLEHAMDVSKNSQQATQQDNIFICSPPYDEDGTDKVEAESSSGFDGTVTDISLFKDVIVEPKDNSKARSDKFMLSGKPDKGELKPSFPVKVENKLDNVPTRAIQLSNKERLILRKQALKMTKRPVLAVGRSNTVIGVAKTIKEHFKKHPLAIVNVKGRAKGTSVREVVFMLEQATGAVLVSQEPSKVILYRGWGAGEKPYHGDTKNANDMEKPETPRLVSPELLAAIRVECGLEAPEKGESFIDGTSFQQMVLQNLSV